MFSTHPEELALSFDPDIGFALIGPCMHRNGAPWLRAVDIEHRRVGWEGASLESAVVPSRRELAVRGRGVYLARDHALLAVDLLTGRERWTAKLSDAAEWTSSRAPGGGCQIIDAFDREGPGAIVVPTADRTLASFDRDTGQLMWRRPYERRVTVLPLDRSGAIAVDLDGRVEVLRAREGDIVTSFGGVDGVRVERVQVEGRCVIAVVREWGPRKREGLLVVDGATGEIMSFDEAPQVRSRCAPVGGGGRVYAAFAAEGGDRVGFVPGEKLRALPRPDATITALKMAGQTLVALAKSGGTRRLTGLDGRSLDVRFESGDLGAMPDGSAEAQMQSDGKILVAVANPRGDRTRLELQASDPGNGALLWRRPAGEWMSHYFVGSHLVVIARGRMEILEADTGKVFAAYPFA